MYRLLDSGLAEYDGRIIGEELGIAYDDHEDMATLLKHGEARLVEMWTMVTRSRYRASGLEDLANSIVLVTFRSPVMVCTNPT